MKVYPTVTPLPACLHVGYVAFLLFFGGFSHSNIYGQTEQDTYAQISRTLEYVQHHQDSLRDQIKALSYELNLKKENRKIYLNPDWQKSYIITPLQKVFYFSGRLNALTQTVEAKLGDGIRGIYPERIKVVVIGERTFLPLRGSDVENLDRPIAYFEVLSHGQIHLLSRLGVRSEIEGGNSLSPGLTGRKVYEVDEDLYYTHNFGRVSRLRSSRKRILELFGDKAETVENFTKENRLRFSGKENLVSIFDYYNQLFI